LSEKAKQKGQTTSGVLSCVLSPEYSVLIKPVLFCSAKLPHTEQSSQLSVGAHDGNAQFLAKLVGAVVWPHKAQELPKNCEVPALEGTESRALSRYAGD